jgi:hypothetical protein
MRIAYTPSTGGGYQPLPEGTYDFQVTAVEEATSSKGTPQVIVTSQVVGGPKDGKTERQYFALTEKATWRFKQLLDACGVAYTIEGDAFDVEIEDLIGTYYEAVTGIRSYEGKSSTDFKKFSPSALAASSDESFEEEETAPEAEEEPEPAPVAAKAAPKAAPAKPAAQPATRRLQPRTTAS